MSKHDKLLSKLHECENELAAIYEDANCDGCMEDPVDALDAAIQAVIQMNAV